VKTASILLKNKLEENIDHFLTNSQTHYLKKVLKIKDGEIFLAFDGKGRRAQCIFQDETKIKIKNIQSFPRIFNTSVLIPFLRKTQFELCLQKTVEVGVNNIICYQSDKTTSKYNFQSEKKKSKRYMEIIESAFLQSENNYLPNLLFIENLFTLSINEFSQICVLDQSSNVKFLPNLSYDLIVSGGEYGFSEDELNFLHKTKASFVKLSENILRAETAPVVALSIQNL
jgi:16S rRNA (uracil1498-N3)-methyltransferase